MFKHIVDLFTPQPSLPFQVLFKKFQNILEHNNSILELMADMGDKLGGEYVFDRKYIEDSSEQLSNLVFKLISDLSVLSQRKNVELFLSFERIRTQIRDELAGLPQFSTVRYILSLAELGFDHSEEAGGKMATIGDIRNHLDLSTPDGFVITAKAFLDFMTQNGLRKHAEELVSAWDDTDESQLEDMALDMQTRIMEAPLPRSLASEIKNQVKQLARAQGKQPLRLVLRSSGHGEDGESSFAGQYESVLNVPADKVIEAYRKVLASAYSPEAWQYRRHLGWREHELIMAVGCMVMVNGQVSGVTQTYAPQCGETVMQTSALWGLCAPVVDGDVQTDTLIMDRTSPYDLLSQHIADKPRCLRPDPVAGTRWEKVSEDRQLVCCLTQAQQKTLAQAVMTLERFYKRPQEVEWTFDDTGKLQILQSHPLHFRPSPAFSSPVNSATDQAEIIFSGRGQVAQCGIAMGKVVKVKNDDDLKDFPHDGILVARYTSPRFSRIMRKAQGIITDVGSPMGHMATIAREYRVPTVVNVEGGTALLRDGEEITLDATQTVVYRGRIMELDTFELTEEEVFEDSYEYRLLKKLLKRMSPLNLVDPHSSDFKPSACRTYHDITRYVHETAVELLIHMNNRKGAFNFSPPKRLESEIPLGLLIVDASGDLDIPSGASTIPQAELTSIPLIEFLSGLQLPGMWCTDPVSVGLGSFMSSFTRTFAGAQNSPGSMGRNLVVVLNEYMNMHLHLGYHYTIIDACLSEIINDNYAYFRFLGGVTDLTRRSRRARFIAQVLEQFDFRVETHGDLVVGRVKKMSQARMATRMRVLGALVGYTRQLDARMHTDNDVQSHVEQFTRAIAPVIGG